MMVSRCPWLGSQEVNVSVKQVKGELRLWSAVGISPCPHEIQEKAGICALHICLKKNGTKSVIGTVKGNAGSEGLLLPAGWGLESEGKRGF